MHDDEPRWASTRHVWRRTGYVMAWAVNVAGAAAFGGTAIGCDPARFAAPTYDGLRDSLGVHGWGTLLVIYAALLITCAWLPARAAPVVFSYGAFVYLAIGAYFAAGLGDPHASPWGPAFGLVLGAWQMTQAEAYRRALRRRP